MSVGVLTLVPVAVLLEASVFVTEPCCEPLSVGVPDAASVPVAVAVPVPAVVAALPASVAVPSVDGLPVADPLPSCLTARGAS